MEFLCLLFCLFFFPFFLHIALCSVTSFSKTQPCCAIGCPTALKWRTTPWSALCAWSPWRLMTSISSPALVATRSAVSVGTASAQTRTASALPAERCRRDLSRWERIHLQGMIVLCSDALSSSRLHFQTLNPICFHVAIPRGPRCVQASVTGGNPKDKEWKEAETEREKAKGDRKPQTSGERPSGPEEPCVCGGAVAAARWSWSEYNMIYFLSQYNTP